MGSARRDHPRIERILAAAVVLLLLPSTFTGLTADDYIHWIRASTGYPSGSRLDLFGFATGAPSYCRALRDVGLLPWFGLESLRLSFFRPLSSLSHYVDYNVWPHAPVLMHAENVALYVALVVAATGLYRRLLPSRWTASLAAIMYAFDPGHGTVGWVAARNGVLAATLGVLAVVAHDRWRKERVGALIGPSLFAASLLAGEAALGAFAYLLAYAVTLDPGATKVRRALSLWPYVALIFVWQLVYRGLGYGAFGSSQYIDAGREPARFLAALPGRAAALLAGQIALFPSELHMYMSHGQIAALIGVAAALLALVVWLALPLLRCEPSARFFALGAILALPSVCSVFPSARNLQFVGLGALGLLAQLVAEARETTLTMGLRSRVRRAAAACIVGLHVVVAPLAFVVSSLVPAALVAWSDRVSRGLPTAAELAGRTAVIVNAPMLLLVDLRFFLPLDGSLHGPHGRLLSSTAGTVVVTRTSVDSVTVRGSDLMGEPWATMVRDDSQPMTVGETVALDGMTARVDALASNGHPSAATFHFDAPLEDSKYVWIGWDGGRFVSVAPPPVGETIVLGREARSGVSDATTHASM